MEAGQVLGDRYRLVERLGGGGTAVVWRAQDLLLGRTVAVKVLAGSEPTSDANRRQMYDEARMAAALSHPHVAQVHDVGESLEGGQPVPYVVMELVEGQRLGQYGAMTVPTVLRLCAQVASALAAAHAIGLVHRDIKPANIVVTSTGAKVVDFGLAATARVGGPAAPNSLLFGTPAYIAPERLTHEGVEPASDVYSLGVVLYRLLCGRLPWTAESTEQLLSDQVYTPPAPLPIRPGVPPVVVDLCTACLAKDPRRRPTAAQVAATLAAAAETTVGVRTAAAVPAHPLGPANPTPVRRRILAAAGGLVTAVLALLAWQVAPTGPTERAEGAAAPPPVTTGDGQAMGTPRPAGPTPTTDRWPSPLIAPSRPVSDGIPAIPGPSQPAEAQPPPPAATTSTSVAPPPTQPPAPAPPQPTTLTSEGGTLTVTCTASGQSRLFSWTPAKGFIVDHVDPGPAPQTSATFRRGRDTVTMTITCDDGTPTARITRTTRTSPATDQRATGH